MLTVMIKPHKVLSHAQLQSWMPGEAGTEGRPHLSCLNGSSPVQLRCSVHLNKLSEAEHSVMPNT